MQAVLTHTYIHIHTHTHLHTYTCTQLIKTISTTKNSPIYLYKRNRQRDGKVKQNKYTMLVQNRRKKEKKKDVQRGRGGYRQKPTYIYIHT